METVQVLLSTYNGDKYLDRQIDSIIKQKGVNISLFVRDDGSSDNTKKILSEWEEKGMLKWFDGENLKPAKSFWDLVMKSEKADYYAFSDQDDIWLPNKLINGINKIKEKNTTEPALYYSKLTPVDENLEPLEGYPEVNIEDDFCKSMIISYAAGCTMVFNDQLMNLAKKYKPTQLRMHDHWLYMICAAVQGQIINDKNSYIQYRQHDSNAVGFKVSFGKTISRLWNDFNENDSVRWKQVKELYESYYEIIPDENLEKLLKIVCYKKSIRNKILLIKDKEIRTGMKIKDLVFFISILTNKF